MKKEKVKKLVGISVYALTTIGTGLLVTGIGNGLINSSNVSKTAKILMKIGLFGISSKVSDDVGSHMEDLTENLIDSVHIIHEENVETEVKV